MLEKYVSAAAARPLVVSHGVAVLMVGLKLKQCGTDGRRLEVKMESQRGFVSNVYVLLYYVAYPQPASMQALVI